MNLLEFRCSLLYPSGFLLDAAFTSAAQVTALFGPSGSGKTSILSIIAGLRRPDAGLVRLGARTLFDSQRAIVIPPEERRVGYVFQDDLLFPHLTIRGNLLYGWRRRSRDAARLDIASVTHVLELDKVLERMPHTLSGGQRRRVAIGRALLCGPEVLLLDEPLAGLDEPLKLRVFDYVKRILSVSRVPTVYVTHDAADVRQLAEHVIVLQRGRVTATGTPAEVL